MAGRVHPAASRPRISPSTRTNVLLPLLQRGASRGPKRTTKNQTRDLVLSPSDESRCPTLTMTMNLLPTLPSRAERLSRDTANPRVLVLPKLVPPSLLQNLHRREKAAFLYLHSTPHPRPTRRKNGHVPNLRKSLVHSDVAVVSRPVNQTQNLARSQNRRTKRKRSPDNSVALVDFLPLLRPSIPDN